MAFLLTALKCCAIIVIETYRDNGDEIIKRS